MRSAQHTVIFYEAPHRIHEALDDIVAVLGPERPLVIARELTKVHEEFLRGTAGDLVAQVGARELKGEITLLIGKAVEGEQAAGDIDLRARLQQIMREQNVDEKAALKLLAKERGVSKSEVYRELQRGKR